MNQTGINPVQAVLGVAKIVLLILLPIVSFAFMGVVIPVIGLTGFRMMNAGAILVYLPLLAYVAMIIFSFGNLRKLSTIAGIVALVVELFFLFSASTLVQQGDFKFLLSLIPKEYNIISEVALANLAKPGIGLILNLLLSILYITAGYLPAFQGSFGTGRGFSGRGNANVNRGGNGTANRNHPTL